MLQQGETVQVLTRLFGTRCVVLATVVNRCGPRARLVTVRFEDGECCVWPVSDIWPLRSHG